MISLQSEHYATLIVAPWIMESIYCSLTNKCTFYETWKCLNLHENTNNYRSYIFRSSTILRELVQSLAKVTLLLKHSVKWRCCILCGDLAACLEMACVLFVVQTADCTTNSTHAISRHAATSPHNIQWRNFTECFNRSLTLARLCGDVVACREMACVLFVVQTDQSAQQTAQTPFQDMLPHLHTIYNDVILLNILTEV